MNPDHGLVVALILALGLAIRFYVRARRAESVAALYKLPLKDLGNWELIDAIHRGVDAQAEFNKRIAAEEHKKRLAQWDEIAAMKAEWPDRGDAA